VREGAEALLRPVAAADLAEDAYRTLELWDLDWRQEAVAQQFNFGEDSRIFLSWAERFEAVLETKQLSTLVRLAPELAAGRPVDELLLAEFGDLPPRYRRALALQCANLRQHRAEGFQADCKLQPCDSHRGELEAAARWARENHQRDPQRRIGILLPGLAQERSEVERFLQREFNSDSRRPDTLPVNFSAGSRLAECGPVAAAMALLSLPLNPANLAELGHVLMSRFRDSTELEQELVALQYLLDDAREPVTPALFRRQLDRVENRENGPLKLSRWLREAGDSRALRARRLPSLWFPVFGELLEAAGWPGPGSLDSLEFQQVEQFQQTLAGLADLDVVLGSVQYADALAALEQLVGDSIFQAQTADAPIQVLGLLEGEGIQFDALWICNMGANEWPRPARTNPFIPIALQRRDRMPHADAARELEYAQQLLSHLGQSCGELIASYARLDDEAQVPPTSLLAGATRLPDHIDRPWPAHWKGEKEAGLLETVEEESAPPVDEREAETIRGGSSILGNQAQCPFRAFAYHRLQARPIPEPQPALTAAERGGILHEALSRLWAELESSERLAQTSEAERQTLAMESARGAVDGVRKRFSGQRFPALLDLEEKRLTSLLQNWLKVECQRESFVVAAREQRYELQLGPLTITLRVDRVDELPDGRKLVIDYKSGDSKVRLWLGERPEDPQLPLYAQLLAAEQVEGVSFAVLRH
jgi:probable DNA repair protein